MGGASLFSMYNIVFIWCLTHFRAYSGIKILKFHAWIWCSSKMIDEKSSVLD